MLDPLLAAAPIAAVLGLMLGARWSAARAGAVGLVGALAIAWIAFPFPGVDGDRALGTAGALAEAVFTAAAILWIVLPALAIHRLQGRTGAVDDLRSGLASLSSDPRLTALLVAWFFALLLEGAAGFGTAAALAAPFLVALGMTPLAAVTAAMLGHAVGVTFGAVGTPLVPQIESTGVDALALSGTTAIYGTSIGWAVAVVVALLIHRAYRREGHGDPRGMAAWGILAAIAFLPPYFAIASLVGPELPTLGGAILGGVAFIAVIGRRQRDARGDAARSAERPPAERPRVDRPPLAQLARAAAPYLVLVALVLGTRLVTPLRDVLLGVDLGWEAAGGTFSGSLAPLYHPGSMLLVALLVGARVQGASGGQVRGALAATARDLVPVAVALVAMLGLARVLVHAGMIESIASAAADAVGGGWPLLAPSVGVLGTFVTGSATASNALFSDLQAVTAGAVGADVVGVLGAQGFGAAMGNAVAPHNLIAAAAVVGLAGRESEILRRTLPVVAVCALASGLIALLIAGR